jgi:hypothetical protein
MPTGLKNPVEQVRHYSNIKIAYPRGQVNIRVIRNNMLTNRIVRVLRA